MLSNVFLINPPQDDAPGSMLLLITRGSGPFAAGHPSVFAVDGLIYNPNYIAAYLGEANNGTVVTQFPTNTNYLLVDRKLVKSMTQLELARIQKEEDAAIDAELGISKSTGDPLDPQGYL